MSTEQTHYSAKYLAGLPGMPGHYSSVIRTAEREGWESRKRSGKGGGYEYAFSSLPMETQTYLQPSQSIIVPQPSPVRHLAVIQDQATPELTSLSKKQLQVVEARVWFMRLIERNIVSDGIEKVFADIGRELANGNQQMTAMAAIANVRQRDGITLSARTVERWYRDKWLASGRKPGALAPNDNDGKRLAREDGLVRWLKTYVPGTRNNLQPGVPEWLPFLIDEYRNPQKPSLADAHREMEKMLPAGMFHPNYDQVWRIYKKLPATLLEKGRATAAEYKKLLGYTQRDASMDDPFAICQIDGHSLKAYVAHPTTGAHFHPEICGIICLSTKVLGGWSAGLAESNETVSDAYRHCCTVNEEKWYGSVPAIVEPDRGPGNLANVNADKLTGRFSRLGTTFLPPEKGGNPQGHGSIERLNQSLWIRAAKSLITYTGKDMDRVTRKRVYVRLEKDLNKVKRAGNLGKVEKTSELLMSWREFLAWLDDAAAQYNNTPHSALPKITCPQTGRRRHMTPLECLADKIARGWQPVTYPEDLMPYLFMPHQKITVNRCKFTLHGNQYHSYELTHRHDTDMIVAYDIHCAKNVWVLDLEERLVCVANWNGNRVEAQPKSVKEQAIQKREERRVKNTTNKLEMMQAESRSALVLEHSPELAASRDRLIAELNDTPVIEYQANVVRLPLPEPVIERVFDLPAEDEARYIYWCQLEGMANGGVELTADEERWFYSFQNSRIWKSKKAIGR